MLIFFYKNFVFKILNLYKFVDSWIVLMNIEYDNNIIILVNVYVLNLENLRMNFYKKVVKWILLYVMNVENLIFVGDFNCCV